MPMVLHQFMQFSTLWLLANLINVKKNIVILGLPHKETASTTVLSRLLQEYCPLFISVETRTDTKSTNSKLQTTIF